MKTCVLVVALLVNGIFLLVAGLAAWNESVAVPGRVCAALVAAALAGCIWFLLLARARRLPIWGDTAMRFLSCGVPLLWLLGSLDSGVASSQEAIFLLVVALLAWGTWRVFQSFLSPPNSVIKS